MLGFEACKILNLGTKKRPENPEIHRPWDDRMINKGYCTVKEVKITFPGKASFEKISGPSN